MSSLPQLGGCVVLSDAVVKDLLGSLSREEIVVLLGHIAASLKQFSIAEERNYQPDPAVVRRPSGRKILFRLFTSTTGVGVKIIVDPTQLKPDENLDEDAVSKLKQKSLQGLIALCDENGTATGFINAAEVTGIRTAMSAIVVYIRRKKTAKMVVFGAGKQALWHLRLALGLRGQDIRHVTVVNRSSGRSQSLIDQITEENNSKWKASVTFDTVQSDDETKLKAILSEADVVFCTTPSREVLFSVSHLGDLSRGCYISAIGSWQSDMIELDPELIKITAREFDSRAMVIVDDRPSCMEDTGELTRSGLREDEVAEIGEILDLTASEQFTELQDKTKQCLETGLVVYKSVGVSVTDLAAGQAILELAKKRNQGLKVDDF